MQSREFQAKLSSYKQEFLSLGYTPFPTAEADQQQLKDRFSELKEKVSQLAAAVSNTSDTTGELFSVIEEIRDFESSVVEKLYSMENRGASRVEPKVGTQGLRSARNSLLCNQQLPEPPASPLNPTVQQPAFINQGFLNVPQTSFLAPWLAAPWPHQLFPAQFQYPLVGMGDLQQQYMYEAATSQPNVPIETIELSDSEDDNKGSVDRLIVNKVVEAAAKSSELSNVELIQRVIQMGYTVTPKGVGQRRDSGNATSSDGQLDSEKESTSNQEAPLPDVSFDGFEGHVAESTLSSPPRVELSSPMHEPLFSTPTKRMSEPPSNMYSFLQHANNSTASTTEQCKSFPRQRYFSDSSPLKDPRLHSAKPPPPPPAPRTVVPTYQSPLENVYPDEAPRSKISIDEYKRRKSGESMNSTVLKRSQPVKVSAARPTATATITNSPETSPAKSDLFPTKDWDPLQLAAVPKKGILKINGTDAIAKVSSARSPHKPKIFTSITPQKCNAFPKKTLLTSNDIALCGKPKSIVNYHHKDYYYKTNSEDKTKCIVCRGSFKFITRHFKEKHPEYEVLISRISDSDLQLAEEEKMLAVVPPMQGQYKCRLCPEVRSDLKIFKEHCTFHTGEYMYICSECTYRFPYETDAVNHWKTCHAKKGKMAKPIVVDMFPQPEKDNFLQGYVCPICNFLQLSKARVEDHMERWHGADSLRSSSIKSINMVIPLPEEEETEPIVSKRGRKRKDVNYKEFNGAGTDEKPKRGRKKKATSSDTASWTVTESSKLVVKITKSPVQKKNKQLIEDDVPCIECGELYSITTKRSDWLKCVKCLKWLHSDCTSFNDTCNCCGNIFLFL